MLQKGRPVAGLQTSDFEVLDGGVPQPVTYFGRESDPLRLVLVLDMSGSVVRYRRQLAASADKALSVLKPGDRAAVLLYGRNSDLYIEMTDDPNDLTRGIQTAEPSPQLGAGTATYQTLIRAADYLRETSEAEGHGAARRRNAILILTDNGGLNYLTPDEAVLKALDATGAVLNAIVVGGAKPPKRPRDTEGLNPDFTPTNVFLLAGKTGGEALPSNRADKAFPELMERLRTRYLLLYRAPVAPGGSYHRVQVRLTEEARRRFRNAEVRVREGYYVPGEAASW